MSILSRIGLLASILVCVNVYSQEAETRSGTTGSREPTIEDYDQLWKKYTTNPNNEKGQNQKFYRVIAVDERSAMVYFTKEDNPAHPSYFKIFPYTRSENGSVATAGFRLESFTLGNKAEYQEALKEMSEFTLMLNKKLQDEVNSDKK